MKKFVGLIMFIVIQKVNLKVFKYENNFFYLAVNSSSFFK